MGQSSMSGKGPTDRMEGIDGVDGRSIYYDADRGTYHTWIDDEAYEPVSTALLLAVSAVLEVEAADMAPLYESVDPDALNALFGHWRGEKPRGGEGTVGFEFERCRVTVSADGEIVIEPLSDRRVPA